MLHLEWEPMANIGILTDIGNPSWHVGDDAIALSSFKQIKDAGHTPYLFTHDATRSQQLVPGANFLRSIEFPELPLEREEFFLSAQDFSDFRRNPVADELAQLHHLDALIIGGGGSINSYFSRLLLERSLFAQYAKHIGLPVAISGQSVGPLLLGHEEQAVRRLFDSADLIGVRGPFSKKEAQKYTSKEIYVAHDDAICFSGVENLRGGDFIAGCFNDAHAAFPTSTSAALIAATLDRLSKATGLTTKLISHMADSAKQDQDVAFHEAIAQHMSTPVEVFNPAHPSQLVPALQGASLSVTNRFHQGVFAMTSAIPTLLLAPNLYANLRMTDLLANLGLDPNWVLPEAALDAVESYQAIDQFVALANQISSHLQSRMPKLHTDTKRWWQQVVAVCTNNEADASSFVSTASPTLAAPEILAKLHTRYLGQLQLMEDATADHEYLARAWQLLESYERQIHALQDEKRLLSEHVETQQARIGYLYWREAELVQDPGARVGRFSYRQLKKIARLGALASRLNNRGH